MFLIGIVAFLASLAVSGWLRSTYSKWSKVQNAAGLTGAEVARTILQANGIDNVQSKR